MFDYDAVIVGGGAIAKGAIPCSLALAEEFNMVRKLDDGSTWNGFNVLHLAAARMGGLMLGFAQKGGIADVIAQNYRR